MAQVHTQADTADTGNLFFDPAQTAATKCLCPLPAGIRRQLTEAYTRQLAFDARLATGALSAALATRARGLPPAEVLRPRARFCHWARARRRCKLPCHHVYACCGLRAARFKLWTARYTPAPFDCALHAACSNCQLPTGNIRQQIVHHQLSFALC